MGREREGGREERRKKTKGHIKEIIKDKFSELIEVYIKKTH